MKLKTKKQAKTDGVPQLFLSKMWNAQMLWGVVICPGSP